MSYQSGEFEVPGGPSTEAAPAVASFAGSLWIIGGSADAMTQTTLQVIDDDGKGIDIENGAALQAANWKTAGVQLPGGVPAGVSSRCAAPVAGDGMYLCWNSVVEGGALRVAKYSADGDGKVGWQWVVTLVAAGDPLGAGMVAGDGAEVAAVAFGADTLIVACPVVSAWWAPGPTTFYIGTFDVGDVNLQAGTWTARSDIWGGDPQSAPFGNDFTFPDYGTAISMDWFACAAPGTTAETPPDPTESTPSFQLWVTLAPVSSSLPPTLVLPVDSIGNVTYGAQPPGWSAPSGGAVIRDPAGRIRQYGLDPNVAQIDVTTYPTWSAPDPSTSLSGTTTAIPAPAMSNSPAAVGFFTDMTQPTTVTFEQRPGTAYPVYEFVLYGTDHLFCQVDRYGTAQAFPGFGNVPPLQPVVPDTVIISGIVDGPIPVPDINFANVVFQDTQPTFGEIVYGQTESKDQTHTVTNSWTAGFTSEAESDKGWGPAWDISINGGMGYVSSDGTTSSLSNSRTAASVLDPSFKRPNQQVLPVGHVFCSEAVFEWTAYRFFDADGNLVGDGTNGTGSQQAPLYTTVTCVFTDGEVQTYVPYSVTPGDLASYTKEAWDARMATIGYAGTSYVEDVIEPNAYEFAEGISYLTASWDNGGGTTDAAFGHTSTSFTETSWQVDASVYVGVSGGEGASIFGFGEDWSFKFLVGGTYSHTAVTSTGTENEWSIGLEQGWGQIGTLDAPPMMKNYVFRIYFLPAPGPGSTLPPNYWVTELKQMLPSAPPSPRQLDPNTIDPNSCAWKIVFIVDSYESVDGQTHYP